MSPSPRSEVVLPNATLQAALGYARRGWRIIPCDPKTKRPLVPKDRHPITGEPVPGSGGLRKATRDEEAIKAWWKKWPSAMIGAATGAGMDAFVVDFDTIDKKTGEIFELGERIAALEALVGPLPATAMARTPGGGCHLYFALPELPDGVRLGNSDKRLPFAINVRGDDTGYVIVPPSVRADGGSYRWERRYSQVGTLPPPAALIDLLTIPEAAAAAPGTAAAGGGAAGPAIERNADRMRPGEDPVVEALRSYGLRALDSECRAIRGAGSGVRNSQLNESALKIASLTVAAPLPALEPGFARAMVEAAARDNPGRDDDRQLIATIDSGWSAGLSNPRDLGEIAAAARDRAARPRPRSRAASRPRTPDDDINGKPSSQSGASARDDEGRGRGGGSDGGAERPAVGAPGGRFPGSASVEELDRRCACRPLTDLGNLERFLERHGHDFLYVEQWGWLAWDGSRWNRDMAMALLGHAVQRTMRAIQAEADLIRASGLPEPELEMWDAEQKRAHRARQAGRLDKVVKKARGETILLSDTIAKWGRTSEGAGHINCIARLAEARLSARPDQFDADPLKLNVANGTIVFLRPADGLPASAAIREHRREDRMTKIAAAAHDERAGCPAFEAFLAKVQPEPEMRAFLDIWAGYNSLGLADAQKMCVFYGEGSNGKGVWITTVAHILGDYAWKAAIETYIDQGRYRKGSDASPDLAALAGRRMVYANEPEDNSKFSDGLVKAMTSDEPLGGVRELNKSPFELPVTFTNTVLANNRPKIGTDHGIQRRMQIVPWDVIIPDEEQNLRLKDELKAEASGILNRIVAGAIAYLAGGLPVPEAVREATRDYHQENDLLGGFLALCVARVPGETVGATQLHRLFAAWQTWAQQLPATGKPWSAKYLAQQMEKKKFKKDKSSTMRWHDMALRYDEADFVDLDGEGKILRPVETPLPEPRRFDGETGPGAKPARSPTPPDEPPGLGDAYDEP